MPEDLARRPVISAAVIGRPLRLSAYYGGQPRQHVVLEPTVLSRNYAFLRDAMRAGRVGIVPDYGARGRGAWRAAAGAAGLAAEHLRSRHVYAVHA